VSHSIDGVGASADGMAEDVVDANQVARDSWEALKKSLTDSADGLIDDVFDPVITAYKLAATNSEISAARRAVAATKAGTKERREAEATLLALQKDQAEYLVTLASTGNTASDAYKTGIASLKKNIANATGPAKVALQAILDKIREVEAAGKSIPVNILVKAMNAAGGQGKRPRAAGGPVRAGVPYLVNENTARSEVFVPSASGGVLNVGQAQAALSAAGGVGGGPSITIYNPEPAAADEDIGRTMRTLSALGLG
jgi:hypothetical protein